MPPVLCCADDCRSKVIDADAALAEVVEMGIERTSGRFEGDVNGFVTEEVLSNYETGDWPGGIDVDAGGA